MATTAPKQTETPRDPRVQRGLKAALEADLPAEYEDAIVAAIEAALEPEDDGPVLDINTQIKAQRQQIRVDGELYELRSMHEFGVIEQHNLIREGDEYDRLWNRPKGLTGKDAARLAQLLDAIFNRVLDAPKEVKRRFSDTQKQAVVATFTYAPLAALESETETETETEETSLPTTDD